MEKRFSTPPTSGAALRVISSSHLTFAFLMCVVLFAPLAAFALGEVKVESSGFLRSSSDRSDTVNTLQFGPRMRSDNDFYEARLDAFGIVQLSDRSTLTLDAPEAYVGGFVGFDDQGQRTGKKSDAVYLNQFSIGRKLERWSILDDYWEFGLISPRFTWDPTRPRKDALTGATYEFSSPHFRLVAFGSAVNIPERGFPIKAQDGKLITSDPFAQQQYESAVISNTEKPIHYNINTPPISEIIFHPSYLVSARVQESSDAGAFLQAVGGRLPINQVNLAIYPVYSIPHDAVDVQVYAQILNHTLYGGEAGYRASRFTVWVSAFRDIPDVWSTPDLWVAPRIEPATITSAGFDFFFLDNVRFKSSILHVDEAPKPATVNNDFTVDLPSRYPFHRATRTGLEIYGSSTMRYEFDWRHDLDRTSDIVSANIYMQLLQRTNAFTFSLGCDFFASATTSGTIGGWKGNDRIRGGIAYAF